MTVRTLLLATCLLAGTDALAQPDAPPPPPETPPAVPPPPTEQPPQPPRPPQPVVLPRARYPEDAATQREPEPALVRPSGFSLGIGVGYKFPTSLQTPNVTSVRFRFANGVTIEPTIVFANTSHSVDTGSAMTGSASELGIGAMGRFPLVQRRRTDLELLAALDVDRLSTDPDTSTTDDVLTVTTTSVRYGVAVGAWITPHLQASLSATNGLITYAKNRQEMGVDSVTVTSDTTFGLIFDPTVVAMLHLYN